MYLGHANFGDISLAMRKSMSYDIKIAHTYFIWKFHRFLFFLQNEKYYLRALGDNPRTDIADITKQFPELAEDIHIPQFFSPEKFFSSVFRISSNGIQLWTHYDVIYYYSILRLQLPMQSVFIITNEVSSNPTHGEVYWIQYNVIKFVSDLW